MPLVANGSGMFISPEVIAESFNLEKGTKVAEFGCGSGYFSILMAQKVGPEGEVSVIDVLTSVLETLRNRAAALNIKNIRIIRANLESARGSRLEDKSQDFVLIANLIFQVTEKEEILAEAKRVLKPDGAVIVIDWKKEIPGFGPPMEQRTSPEEIKALAQKTGLYLLNEINAGAFHFGLKFKRS